MPIFELKNKGPYKELEVNGLTNLETASAFLAL